MLLQMNLRFYVLSDCFWCNLRPTTVLGGGGGGGGGGAGVFSGKFPHPSTSPH